LEKPRDGALNGDNDADGSGSEGSSASSSANPRTEYDWKPVSDWCQGFLSLSDSELDSLWYERFAELSYQKGLGDMALELYQRALAQPNPSWMCHTGLATLHSGQDRVRDAIPQVELALEKAEREDATPPAAPKDIVELQLQLAEYTYGLQDFQRAADLYWTASKSEDRQQATEGSIGHFKASLYSPDTNASRDYLRSIFLQGEHEKGALMMGLVALDPEHDSLVPKMFAVSRRDTDLLKGVVRAMETATADATRLASQVCDTIAGNDVRFIEATIAGGLLFDRGIAAYRYKVPPEGTEPVSAALRLWSESCEKLSRSGGRNAWIVRQGAATALAQHYFQTMVDGNHLDHIGALQKLAEADNSDYDDAPGFLAAMHAIHGAKQAARETLTPRVERALQILSDDILDNDFSGYSLLLKSLGQYQDLQGAAVALSLLSHPDLVTDAFIFDINDMPNVEGVSGDQLLSKIGELAKEVIRNSIDQFPDPSQQSRRIEAAKSHVDSLLASCPGRNDTQTEPTDPDLTTRHLLLSSLHSRVMPLYETHVPEVQPGNFRSWIWTCDGRTPDGKKCDKVLDFACEFYHCTYCSNRDFCRECLVRLRELPHPDDEAVDIMACDPKHRWLRMPPHGTASYVGPRAKWVPVPKEVRPLQADGQVLEVCYDEDGDRISVAEWKESVAKEWGLSVEGAGVRQASPDVNGQADAETAEGVRGE